MNQIVAILLYVLAAYALVGFLLLPLFLLRALPRLDPSADGASVGFRAVVSPGLVALWPLILSKWISALRGGNPYGNPNVPLSSAGIRQTQSVLIKLIAVALPLLVAAAIFGRTAPAAPVDPVLLHPGASGQ